MLVNDQFGHEEEGGSVMFVFPEVMDIACCSIGGNALYTSCLDIALLWCALMVLRCVSFVSGSAAM